MLGKSEILLYHIKESINLHQSELFFEDVAAAYTYLSTMTKEAPATIP